MLEDKSAMKIGLLTHHWPANFGCNLQALATYRYLVSAGQQATVINYRPLFLEQRYQQRVSEGQINAHNEFCATLLNQSPLLRTESDIVSYCNDAAFDTIIVGSDTIFRLDPRKNSDEGPFPNVFWMPWASKLVRRPRICAISVSCGGSIYLALPRRLKKDIVHCLREFDSITVRDKWTRWMLSFVSGGAIRPALTADPVSILEHVSALSGRASQEVRQRGTRYLLLSCTRTTVNYQWFTSFVEACHSQGYCVYGLPNPEGLPDLPVDERIGLPLSPIEWYSWIKRASGLIGERFHPIVSCIFNRVPFVSIDNNYHAMLRGLVPLRFRSKQYDLCKRLGQAEYCVPWSQLFRRDPSDVARMLTGRSPVSDRHLREAQSTFDQAMASILSPAQ
jgi:polysaccharide pyruvyl transferase WcaK-like protein